MRTLVKSIITGFLYVGLQIVVHAQVNDEWRLELETNRQATTTVGVRNHCRGSHEFELIPDESMKWFRFTRGSRLVVGEGETRALDAELDTKGVDVDVYRARIELRCVDCAAVDSCESRSIPVRFRVVWSRDDLDRIANDQVVDRQFLSVFDYTRESEIDLRSREIELRIGARRLRTTRFRSLNRAAVLFELTDSTGSLVDAVLQAQKFQDVLFAQPNRRFETQANTAALNDPLESLQYGPRKIRADRLRKFADGRGISVAIIDTGIDADHRELKGRIAERKSVFDGEQKVSGDVHGTLVAGVIASRTNNNFGIAGIAPGVVLIAIKSFKPRSSDSTAADGTSLTLAEGLDLAIQRAVRVINLSIGGPHDPLVAQLIRAAASREIVIVAAAGNDGPSGSPKFPASMDEVIAVTATDNRDEVYANATRGASIDLSAPGVEVLSTVPGNRFNAFSGTSMAAPHVSAVVAMMLSRNPRLRRSEVKSILESTARDLGTRGRDETFGSGLIDACAAIERVVGRKVCN